MRSALSDRRISMTTLDEARNKLALANRILAHEGVLDGFGHVSMRHPADPNRYLLARSRSPELIEPFGHSRIHARFAAVTPADRISLWRACHPWLHLPGTPGRACGLPSSFARRDAVLYFGGAVAAGRSSGRDDGRCHSILGPARRIRRHRSDRCQTGGGTIARPRARRRTGLC